MCVASDIICVYDTEYETDGLFLACLDCNSYVDIRDKVDYKYFQCPDIQDWGFNAETRKCQLKSPHCFDCRGRVHVILFSIVQ